LAAKTVSTQPPASLAKPISISTPPLLNANHALILMAVYCAKTSQFASCVNKNISSLQINAQNAAKFSTAVLVVSPSMYVSSAKLDTSSTQSHTNAL
jgi:hypothetical protein